jgi:hypothetical protein
MNRHFNFFRIALAAGLSAALGAAWPAVAAPKAAPAAAAPVTQPITPAVVARSTFVLPTNPKDGRDPFFPNSSRPYEEVASKPPGVSDVSSLMTSLVLKGISGSPDRRLAIINNHTFGSGDEGDVLTVHGRIHIRCVEIKDTSVVVESGGMRHVLNYTSSH